MRCANFQNLVVTTQPCFLCTIVCNHYYDLYTISIKFAITRPHFKKYLQTSSIGSMDPDQLREALTSGSHSLWGVENSGRHVIFKLRVLKI